MTGVGVLWVLGERWRVGRLCMFCLTLLGRGSKPLPGDLGESLERSSVLSARVRWYGYAVEK